MEIPKPISFSAYVGTLVTNRVLGNPRPFTCPFVVVILHPSSKKPDKFVTNAPTFEEAAIEMDNIQYEGMKYSPNSTEYTVLEMFFIGDIVHWTDRLPMVSVQVG